MIPVRRAHEGVPDSGFRSDQRALTLATVSDHVGGDPLAARGQIPVATDTGMRGAWMFSRNVTGASAPVTLRPVINVPRRPESRYWHGRSRVPQLSDRSIGR
jgi:hypothetical protein